MSNLATRMPNFIRTLDGVDLFYRDWGRGQPLLFLSGWTLNSMMWGYQMEPLSREGYRCVAYDRRGHGRSGDPGRGYDFDTLADDLSAMIEALELDEVILIAHSLAAGEVVRYLTRYGSTRISGIVLVAPAAIPFMLKTSDNPGGIDLETMGEVRAELAEDFHGWADRQSMPYFAGEGTRGVIEATLGMMAQTSHQAMLALAGIQATTDFRQELSRIDVPVLFVHGDQDASAPFHMTTKPAFELVKEARLVVYAGGPHGLYFTHKDQLNQDILSFAAILKPPHEARAD